MYYAIIGIMAVVIHIVINRDLFWHRSTYTVMPARREYRDYIVSAIIFCAVDALWGIMYEYQLAIPLYAASAMFFLAMMTGFVLWTRFVTEYMEERSLFSRVVSFLGAAMLLSVVIMLIINFFNPILFWIDGDAGYHPGTARYSTLLMQVLLFVLAAVNTFVTKQKDAVASKRLRHTIELSTLGFAVLISVQFYHPMLPLYSMGFLFSSCLLHSLVVEDEKEEQHRELEEMLRREQEQSAELGSARKKIYTDPLTGVGSKQAYLDDAERINQLIRRNQAEDMAVAVFDVNDLKTVNDTMGHDTGDIYIYTASMLISEFFEHSPVYRIGGDEFAVILRGEDYGNRESLLFSFDRQSEENQRAGRVVVASGMADYIRESDHNIRDIFERADRNMYARKSELKRIHWQKESANE